jgi:hypothetical protein
MRLSFKIVALLLLSVVSSAIFWLEKGQTQMLQGIPNINNTPTIDSPIFLDWERDVPATSPDLTEPTANRVWDLHANISNCDSFDLILSTSGNYHMALRELWFEKFLPNHPDIKNWYYSTSPPIAPQQAVNKNLTFGNVSLKCIPHIAVGPLNVMNELQELGLTQGSSTPFIRNRGNVILVKQGNPKRIQSVFDLGKPGIRVITPNPNTERGSFENYSTSIYEIAKNTSPPNSHLAENLFNAIFNQHDKWLSGVTIHHREIPHSIAYGKADAGMIFYHLALYVKQAFPDLFDIVPLGGTVENPNPLLGNRVATLFFVPLKVDNINAKQEQARTQLMEAFLSEGFSQILSKYGLDRPQ